MEYILTNVVISLYSVSISHDLHQLCGFSLSPDYNVNFFKQFSLVMNALDNKGIHTIHER